MTRRVGHQGQFVLVLALTASVIGVVQSTTMNEDMNGSRERRHIGIVAASTEEKLSHKRPDVRVLFKSPASKSNEINAEAGKKVSSRLIGGHLRDNVQQDNERSEDMFASSAGNGKETKNSRGDEDEEKKTLSQQVKEGKYGLIQNEIYTEKPRRPGIISYLDNPEVPKDTIENLGGLDEDEIWLAENHVLVLRGGHFPSRGAGSSTDQEEREGEERWPPIDNYQAPRRQVKIPAKPKVPPPFPVQLKDGGPVQIIGVNGSKVIENSTLDRTMDPFYGKGVLPGDGPFFTITSNGTIVVPDFDYPVNVTTVSTITTEDAAGPGVTSDDEKRTQSEEPPTFYHAIPPGAVFVPPPSNRSDYDDEDQSIYYPPPYSFYYPRDNTTAVPPGPLVPGIILPPPPDFFSPLEEKKTTIKKYTKRPSSTPILPKSRPTYLPPRKLTTKQRDSTTAMPKISTTQLPRTRTYIRRPMTKNLTGTTVTKIRPSTIPFVEISTSTSDEPSTLRNTKYYSGNPFIGNGVTESSAKNKVQAWSRSTNAKSLPVLTYYSSATSATIQEPVEVTPASIKNVITTNQPGQLPRRASYYFYEESNDGNIATTVESSPVYYQTTTESPYYKVEPLSQQPRNEKPYYTVESSQAKDTSRDYEKPYYTVESSQAKDTSRDYNVKLIDALVENPQVYQYSGTEGSTTSSKYDSTAGRIENERTLPDQTPIYYQTITARPPVTIQSYYTTQKPRTYYKEPEKTAEIGNRQNINPKPIYQYSFEAADYSKRGQDRPYYREQEDDRLAYNYQTVKPTSQRSDYGNDRRESERTDNVPYKVQSPIYPTATDRPTINVTPNSQHAYFTRQEERLLDDVTKEYFTIFGKKLSGKNIQSTTPIYNKASHVTEKPNYNVNTYVPSDYDVSPPESTYRDQQVYYNDNAPPPNLESDTRVNYRQPLPPINPDSEFVEVFEPKQRVQQYVERPVSLQDDILVNYRDPRPPINPDAEFIEPINVPGQNANPEKSSAYFAYRLPGDSGHFYFLTPQAIPRQEDQNGGHDSGYFYPKPRGPKLLRRRRNHGNV